MSDSKFIMTIICITVIAIVIIVNKFELKKRAVLKVKDVIDLKNILPKKFNKYDVVELHIKEDDSLELIARNEEYNNFDID
jgi:signal recognition particle receptor subunit beta